MHLDCYVHSIAFDFLGCGSRYAGFPVKKVYYCYAHF